MSEPAELETIQFSADELMAANAALILYRAEILNHEITQENGYEKTLRDDLYKAAGSALSKIVEAIRTLGGAPH
jgi:hypothetical protein